MKNVIDFSFSVAGQGVLQQQASTPEEAWVGVRRQVDTLCRQGQLGQNVDPRFVGIKLVNTAQPKQVG